MAQAIEPPEKRGYTHPEFFVTTDWLGAHLEDPGVRIVDTDRPDAYQRVHIKNAVGVSDNFYKSGPDRVHVQGPEEFARTMESLGISNDTLVIASDSDLHFAPRLFWALNYYGHSKVRVLDGGFPKWFAERRPVTRATPAIRPGRFTPRVRPEWIATKEHVISCIGGSGTVLVDVRSDEEWTGENTRGTKRGGHLPGAVHLEWKNFVAWNDIPVLKSGDEIRSILERHGITKDKNVVTY
ncbi:MAG: sulfurtransferase [Chloroflexi bacterium]|nr:sulfurtransferase [Chloroflexota bacterium]